MVRSMHHSFVIICIYRMRNQQRSNNPGKLKRKSVNASIFTKKYFGFSILDIFFVHFSKPKILFDKKLCRISLVSKML